MEPIIESAWSQQIEVSEGIQSWEGAYARKNKDGSCSFILRKKMPKAKSALGIQFGIYPDMSIDEAEAKASQYRNLILEGIDPRKWEAEQAQTKEIERLDDKAKQVTLQEARERYSLASQLKTPPNAQKNY